MFKNLILSFTTVALVVASAATYNVTLYQDSKLNGKTLKPGEYRLEVKDNAVILKRARRPRKPRLEPRLTQRNSPAPPFFITTRMKLPRSGWAGPPPR